MACLSQQSVAKQGYVQREYRMALNAYADRLPSSSHIIPVRLDDCTIPELGQEEYGINLRDIQSVDLFTSEGFERLLKALVYFSKNSHVRAAPVPTSASITEQLGGEKTIEMKRISGEHHIDIGGNVSASPILAGDYNRVTIINNKNYGLTSPSIPQTNLPYFHVPKLSRSSFFIEREKDITTIVNKLIDESQKAHAKDSSVSSLLGLWGPPGYGKSTLAKMVCYQASIREEFTGGVFFVEVSEALDGDQEFKKLCEKLSSSYETNIQLGTLLKQWNNQPSLIVLDNVKTKDKLDSLLEIGESDLTQWLITTQNKEIFVTHQSYEIIEIHPLTKIEVMAALREPFRDDINFNNEKLKRLADLLYRWPLLLGVALERLQGLKQDSKNPEFIIGEVINDIKEGWIKFDHENRIGKSLQKTFDYLSPDERKHFQDLLIFSSDLDIPFSVISHITELPLQSVKNLCSKLYKLALIKSISREHQVVQTSSFIRKYLLNDDDIKQQLIHVNKKFVEHYENIYELDSPENLPESIPAEELKFLKRVYKRHWIREKRSH